VEDRDPWCAWARFRDEFEAERVRMQAVLETARAALSAGEVPVEAVREILAIAEGELARIDAAVAGVHTQLMATRAIVALPPGVKVN
jgi:hypothetical protein